MAADKSKGRWPVTWRSWWWAGDTGSNVSISFPLYFLSLTEGKVGLPPALLTCCHLYSPAPLYPSTFFVRLSGGKMRAEQAPRGWGLAQAVCVRVPVTGFTCYVVDLLHVGPSMCGASSVVGVWEIWLCLTYFISVVDSSKLPGRR